MHVADKLHNDHANLIVGRVDCTKNGLVCEKYEVQSYPTIIYLNKDARVVYKGDRSVQSLVDFAERLNGPDVKQAEDCQALMRATDRHGLIVLSAEKNESSELNKQFKSLASSMKSHFWFYKFRNTCKNFITQDGIYLLKRHLDRSIRFQPDSSGVADDPKQTMTEWLVHNSFPVYGPLSTMNFERVLSSEKLIVIAVLDEYKPAKKFSQPSRDFHRHFERLAREFAQVDERLLFVWSSDLDLIQSIAIGDVLVPNIMLLKNDLSHHILIKDLKELDRKGDEIPLKLRDESVRALIVSAKDDKLNYEGGNSYLHKMMRYIFTLFSRFMNMYRASPLLASILIGLPSVIVIFVIYTTCCYDSTVIDDGRDDEDEYPEDEQSLLNHVKQD